MCVAEEDVKRTGRFIDRMVAINLKQSWMRLSFCGVSATDSWKFDSVAGNLRRALHCRSRI